MTWEEYVDIYGYDPDPKTPEQQADWDGMGDWHKEHVKKERAQYQGPGAAEQALTGEFHAAREGGPDTNIWRGLSEMFGIKGGAIKKFGMDLLGGLTKGTDFAEEYGVGKDALDTQLREAERGVYKRGAARGLLDSSATQAQMGGARGGYAQALAGLQQWKGTAEEQSRQFNLSSLGTLAGTGMNFGQFLNSQYLQDMGLRAQEIGYLQGERGQENQFNTQQGDFPWQPQNLGTVLPSLMQLAGTIYSGGMPMPNMDGLFGGGDGQGVNRNAIGNAMNESTGYTPPTSNYDQFDWGF